MISEAFVVDTRDGYTWYRGASGQPFTQDEAIAYAQLRNSDCRPGHRTYVVCTPTVLDVDVQADSPTTRQYEITVKAPEAAGDTPEDPGHDG